MSSNTNKENSEGNNAKDTAPLSPSPEPNTNNNNTSLSSSNSMMLSPSSSVSASSSSNQKTISNNELSPSSSPHNNLVDSNEKALTNTNNNIATNNSNNKKISSFNINDLLSNSDKTTQLHLNTISDNSQDDSNNKHSPFQQTTKKQKLNSSESKCTSQSSGSRSTTPNPKKLHQSIPSNFQEAFLNQQSLNPYSFFNGGMPPMDLFSAEKLLQQYHHHHQQQHQFNPPNSFLTNPAASIEQFLLQQHSLNALLGGGQPLGSQQPSLPSAPQPFLTNEFLLAKSLHDNSRKLNESNGK
jgi:hypothetical protein